MKVSVGFNGLDILEIAAATETASIAQSHILSAALHAALTIRGPQVDNKNCATVKVSDAVIGAVSSITRCKELQ